MRGGRALVGHEADGTYVIWGVGPVTEEPKLGTVAA